MANQDHKLKRERSDHDVDGREDDGAMKVAVVDEVPTPPLRKCNICGKTFTNGKALGGHRRSHFQASKKNINNNNNKVNKPQTPNLSKDHRARARASSDDHHHHHHDNRTCFVCEKEFPTKNALFGHMRSHPRDWTGLYPPSFSKSHYYNNNNNNNNKKHSFGSVDEEDEKEDWRVNVNVNVNVDVGVNVVAAPSVDLLKFTSPSWKKKDIRGRKCIGNYEAARNLMQFSADCCLAQSPELFLPFKKREIGGGGGGCESSADDDQGNVVNKKKIKFFLSGTFNLGNNNTDNIGSGDYESGSKGLSLSEPVVERISVKKDHSSDHKMKTEVSPVKLFQDHDDGDYFDERKVNNLSKDYDQKSKSIQCLKDSSSVSENEGQKYKCGTCGKTFATYQGLGGHRSIHKQKSKVTEEDNSSFSKMDDETTLPESEATTVAAADEEEASQSTGPKRFDIDLNEPYFDDQL